MIAAGIDIGSITTKAVLLSEEGILGSHVRFTGYNAEQAGRTVLDELAAQLGLKRKDIRRIISTGYGRRSLDFADRALTEIICHGAGAFYQNSGIRCIIDIGGQDSKVILLDETGKVKDFVMNDKCAAGTGRFLEVMARALEVDLEAFPVLAVKATSPARISNLCTVFAESEVISLIAKGTPREEIVAGIHQAIAQRVVALARRIGVREPVTMTGGVARNSGLVSEIERELSLPIIENPLPQVNGALGAAVLGLRMG